MLAVQHNTIYGSRLIATQPFRKGQLLHTFTDYRVVERPSYQTIQIALTQHIDNIGNLAYINHSCHPNTVIDTEALTVRAARDIAMGDELTFFYPSTEWVMDRPFICLCGAPQCIRLVAGAKYLTVETLGRYFINRHIREAIMQFLANAATIPEETSGKAGEAALPPTITQAQVSKQTL
ncbi:MAG: SET domain-containing protein-lysine N-methyltransferase [Caldilineaceae bacterium]